MESTNVVTAWARLSRPALAAKVKAAVRDHVPTPPTEIGTATLWSAVRENAVLAGQVRGLLNALRAETRDFRDHAMWEFKITAVWDLLAAEPPTNAAAAAAPAHYSPAGLRRVPTSNASAGPSTRQAVPSAAVPGTPAPAPPPPRTAPTHTARPRSTAVPAIEFVEPAAPAHQTR